MWYLIVLIPDICTLTYFDAGAGIFNPYGSNGASSGGLGGRGGCSGMVTCKLKRELPYGDLYQPDDYGSGGAMFNGGTGTKCFITTLT